MSTKSKVTDNTLRQLEKISGGPLTLGTLMKAIRLGEEETQASFSEQLSMSRQQLCDIEKGRKYVSAKLAAEYAKRLGYSSRQFIRLALQDQLNRDGLAFDIEVKKAA